MQQVLLNKDKEIMVPVTMSEEALQQFICDHWEKLFPEYTFIKKEFSLKGNVHGLNRKGRIDILAYRTDKKTNKKMFAIFELKRGHSNGMSQATNYSYFVQCNFPVVHAKAKKVRSVELPKMKEMIDEVEIVLIAKTFTDEQIFRAKKSNDLFTLIKYNWFEDDSFLIDCVHNATATPKDISKPPSGATAKPSKWKFSELDISPGVELVFRRDTTKKCRVANDMQVEYEGDLFSLVTLAKKLVQEKIGKEHVNVKKGGLWEFDYEGNLLGCRCEPDSKRVDKWKKKGWQAIVNSIKKTIIKKELQDIALIEPTKEDVPKLRTILTPKTFNSDKRAALLEILAELETQD